MSKPIQLGVIGLGIAFRELHLPVLQTMSDDIEIKALCSRTAPTRQSAAELVEATAGRAPELYESVDALLAAGLDAVLVSVPINETATVATAVAEAGINLVCEKPLAESASVAADLVRLSASKGLTLCVCENFRYQTAFSQAHKLAAEGRIGDVHGYFLNDLHYTPPTGMYAVTEWRTQGTHRGGYLLDGGSHIIAGLRAMVGETPERVHAYGLSFHPDHLGRPWDTAFVNLAFPSGKRGHLTLGYGTPDKEARHAKLLGTEGTIAVFRDKIEVWSLDGKTDDVVPLQSTSSGIPEEWQDFVPALASGAPLTHSPWESVRDLALFDAIMSSLDSSETVQVQQFDA